MKIEIVSWRSLIISAAHENSRGKKCFWVLSIIVRKTILLLNEASSTNHSLIYRSGTGLRGIPGGRGPPAALTLVVHPLLRHAAHPWPRLPVHHRADCHHLSGGFPRHSQALQVRVMPTVIPSVTPLYNKSSHRCYWVTCPHTTQSSHSSAKGNIYYLLE